MKTLDKKVAIITGAGSGIGRAIALLYSSEGAIVVLTDVDDKGGNDTLNEIKSKGGEAIFIKADTSNPQDSERVVNETMNKYSALHISVNNAGISGPLSFTGDYPIEGWNKVISINLSGVFYGMRYQIPAMLKSGGGSIEYCFHPWKSWSERVSCICCSQTWCNWVNRSRSYRIC